MSSQFADNATTWNTLSSEEKNAFKWLVKLGVLSAARMSAEEAQTKIEVFAPLLASRFSSSMLTDHSLGFVAAQCKFFPTYGELCQLLYDYQRENAPPRISVRAKEPDEPYVIPPAPAWALRKRLRHLLPTEEEAKNDTVVINTAEVERQINALGFASRSDVPKPEPRPQPTSPADKQAVH